jgi:hypothetical protein
MAARNVSNEDPVAASIANELEDLLELGDAPEVVSNPLPPLPPGISPRDVLLYPGNRIFQGVDSPLTPFWMNSSPGTPNWLKGEFPRTPGPQGVRELLRSPAWSLSPLKNSMRRAVQAEGMFAEAIISHSAQRDKPMMPSHWQSLDLQREAEPEGGEGRDAPAVGKWHRLAKTSSDLEKIFPQGGQQDVPGVNGGQQGAPPLQGAPVVQRSAEARAGKGTEKAQPVAEAEVRDPPLGENAEPRAGGASQLVLERDSALLKGWAAQSTTSSSGVQLPERTSSGMTVSSMRPPPDRSGAKTPMSQAEKSFPPEEDVRRSAEAPSEAPRGSILKRRAFKPLTSLVTKSPREENKTGPRRKRGFLADPVSAAEAEGFWEDEDMADVQEEGEALFIFGQSAFLCSTTKPPSMRTPSAMLGIADRHYGLIWTLALDLEISVTFWILESDLELANSSGISSLALRLWSLQRPHGMRVRLGSIRGCGTGWPQLTCFQKPCLSFIYEGWPENEGLKQSGKHMLHL